MYAIEDCTQEPLSKLTTVIQLGAYDKHERIVLARPDSMAYEVGLHFVTRRLSRSFITSSRLWNPRIVGIPGNGA